MKEFTFEEAFKSSVEYFNGDELAAKVFLDANALRDNKGNLLEDSPIMMHRRMAKEFARIESKKFKAPLSEEDIFNLFDKFKFLIPQSSPMTGIGNNYQVTSLSNCIHGESLVYTLENGLIPMKLVKVGVHVLTHKGRFKKVLNHWSTGKRKTYSVYRTFSNMSVSLQNEQEMSRFLAATPEHKVLTDEGEWVTLESFKKHHYKHLKSPTIKYEGNIPNVFPIGLGRHIEVNNDFLWFLGLYLAEGGVKRLDSNTPSIYLTFSSKEEFLAEKVNQLCLSWFGHEAWIQRWNNYNFIQINIFESEFTRLILSLCGHGFSKKRLPMWTMGLQENEQISLLDGFLRGDATNYKAFSDNYIIFVIANPTLAYELGLMARNTQKFVRFNFLTKGKLIKNRTIATTFCTKQDFIKINQSPVEVEVFDMEVEEDNSFVAGDIICHNCYVGNTPNDSYGSIMRTDEQIVQISKRRGGIGINVSRLRPRGTPTRNSAKSSTGVVSFSERFSHSIREVGQAGRRGALMLALNIHHPESVIIPDDNSPLWSSDKTITLSGNPKNGERDIVVPEYFYDSNNIDFVSMKLDRKKVTGANISVILTNEFLDAVANNKPFEQRFPVESSDATIRKQVNARNAWRKIIHMAWQSAEPGLLFWDRMTKYNAVDCYEADGFRTVSVNPCAEIGLNELDSCRLQVINLLSFVSEPFTAKASFDFVLFKKIVAYGMRLMDDLIDLELEKIDSILNKIQEDPESIAEKRTEFEMWQEIKRVCLQGRRTGFGPTALGDTLAALGIRYDSKEAISMVDSIFKAFKHSAFDASCEIAKELGPFPIWDWEKEKNSEFLLQIKEENPELYYKISKYGRRNIACLTVAPTGTPSIFARTSSGCEPVFSLSYTRRKKINPGDANAVIDFVDSQGDSWQHFTVYHPQIKEWMRVTGKTDVKESPWFNCDAASINWKQRVLLQSAMQQHIDHSISSTINLPFSATEADVAQIYETAWRSKCKGITVYREGCRSGVLVKEDCSNKEEHIIQTIAPKRPKELAGEIFAVSYKKDKLYVAVGFLGKSCYEVFTGVNFRHKIENSKGKIVKKSRGQYIFMANNGEEYYLTNGHSDENADALTRIISASLRHGCDISFLVHQLEKSQGDLQSFSKVIARVLKKFISDGTKVFGESCHCGGDLKRENGCIICSNCGTSKCS